MEEQFSTEDLKDFEYIQALYVHRSDFCFHVYFVLNSLPLPLDFPFCMGGTVQKWNDPQDICNCRPIKAKLLAKLLAKLRSLAVH